MRKECSSNVSSRSFGGALGDIQKTLQGRLQVSKLIFENNVIRNRISNDFDKRCICQQKAQ